MDKGRKRRAKRMERGMGNVESDEKRESETERVVQRGKTNILGKERES